MKLKRPLPQGAVVGGIVAAGLVVLAIGYLGVIGPQNHKAAALEKQAADTEQQISSNMAAVAAQKSAATSAVSAPKIRVADVYKLAKAMPSTLDMPDILLELDQVAKASGVDLQDISPGTPGADGTISLGMTVEGDFYTITDLLYRLRNLVSVRNGALDASGRLFTIDSLSLGPGAKNGIDASITLHTYEYVPAAPAAAPAAPVVTSTDTTATTTTDTTSSSGPSAAGAQP